MRLIPSVLLFAAAAFAATPDFSGTWKLNGSKSDFGQFPPTPSITQKVTHAEPKVSIDTKMTTDNGDLQFAANYTTDGKPTTNQGFGGSEMKSTAKWDGESLVMESKGSFGDGEFTIKDKWTLSDGGKLLTVQRHFSSGMGDSDQKLVFEKQ